MAYKGHDDSYLTHGGIYEVSLAVTRALYPPPSVILDLGSRHGEGYERLGTHFPDATYVFVEPAPECGRYIDDVIASYPDRKFCFVRGILGEEKGAVSLITFENDDAQSSNLFTDRGGTYGAPTTIEVPVVPYDYVFATVDEIPFAKVNIEGGEYELVESSFFDRITCFVMELHNFVPGRKPMDVVELLKDRYDLTTYGNLTYKYCYVVGHRC